MGQLYGIFQFVDRRTLRRNPASLHLKNNTQKSSSNSSGEHSFKERFDIKDKTFFAFSEKELFSCCHISAATLLPLLLSTHW